jgi:hypothetical protein
VVAEFSDDRLTTEGGALLLREADRKIDLLRRVADCFTDTRQPERCCKGWRLSRSAQGRANGCGDEEIDLQRAQVRSGV